MRRRFPVVSVLCLLTLAGCGQENGDADVREDQSGGAASAAAEIRDVLETQAEAWNQGSIGGFMAGYAQTDTVRFASGGRVWRGWTQTLQRYRESYPDEGLMGRLNFTDLEIWPMSDDYAVVFGRWELTRSEQYQNIGGLFTLVFERGPEGWRIVHDHTSSRETIDAQESAAPPADTESPQSTTPPADAESPQFDTTDAQ